MKLLQAYIPQFFLKISRNNVFLQNISLCLALW